MIKSRLVPNDNFIVGDSSVAMDGEHAVDAKRRVHHEPIFERLQFQTPFRPPPDPLRCHSFSGGLGTKQLVEYACEVHVQPFSDCNSWIANSRARRLHIAAASTCSSQSAGETN